MDTMDDMDGMDDMDSMDEETSCGVTTNQAERLPDFEFRIWPRLKAARR